MAKAKNNIEPVTRQRKAKVAAAQESAKELADRHAAEWVKSNPGLAERLKRAAEQLKKLKPARPSEDELAARAEHAAARKEMARYIAIRDNQIPPPWLEKNKLERPLKSRETAEPADAAPIPAITKETIARQIIQELYGCAAHMLSTEHKTGTVRHRVNENLKLRNNPEHLSWDTTNRALGRDSRRKQ
jgi:hypothetical protein